MLHLAVCSAFLVGASGFLSQHHHYDAFFAKKPTNVRLRNGVAKQLVLHNMNQNFGGDGNDEEEEREEIIYNDFDFVIGDGAATGNDFGQLDNTSADEALQARIRSQQQDELKRETKLLQNWKRGDWSVRGFSLDPADAIDDAVAEMQSQEQVESTTPIYVSKVVQDANSEGSRVWVGRNNGSLVWVQLGSEITTHFRSQIRGRFARGDPTSPQGEDSTSSISAQFSSELVRDPNSFPPGDQGPSKDQPNYSAEDPFQILAQFSPASEESPISHILSVEEEDCIFTACEGSGQIKQWHVSEADIDNGMPALQTPLPLSEGIHNDVIVALKTVFYQESPLLLSVSADGVMALWDIPRGDLISHCQISVEEIIESGDDSGYSNEFLPSSVIHCADVDAKSIFLGTPSGFVLGYDLNDLLLSASSGGTCPLPQAKFKAHEGGVTAIACGGPGTLGRLGGQEETSSTVLITGGVQGQVKQWEMISSPSMQKMENWPKMSTQRLPKKAHIFEGHDGPVTALEAMGPHFLSASEDGTIRAWDVVKGKENYRMDGFTKELSSLCVLGSGDGDDDYLVTDGMNQYVCVHDFSQGLPGDSVDDFIEPWDE